jgi:flavodoxin
MNYTIRYYSKGGNTKKLADALAQALQIETAEITQPINEKTDILFLGASVYYAGIDPKVKAFIKTLDPAKVKSVAVFSTSAMSERAFPQIQKLVEKQGIACLTNNFYCRGQFAMLHRGHPNKKDLEDIKAYAKSFESRFGN